MTNMEAPESVDKLKEQLQQIRRASLLATRQGDYMRMARLTAEAAVLNKAIVEAEGLVVVGIE
jgi:hypothetical protein